MPSDCGNWAWYYSFCAGDPGDRCPGLATCAACVTEGRAEPLVDPTSCGWCIGPTGAQRCVSGAIAGPAIGARCAPGGWLFSQFSTQNMCPAAPASASRTASATPSVGAAGSATPSPTPSPSLTATPTVTPTLGGAPASGGGGASGLDPAAAVAIALGVMLAFVAGAALGWCARRARGAKPWAGQGDAGERAAAPSQWAAAGEGAPQFVVQNALAK